MIRFCSDFTPLFYKQPFSADSAETRKAGFSPVEFISPYELGLEQVRRWVPDQGMEVELFNCRASAV